jgi:hypothetical protein
MALDPNSAIGQAETANSLLAEYFNNMNKFLLDSTGAVLPPDVETFINSLDYSELHRLTSIRATDASSYENGAAIENIHQMVAVIREYSLRRKSKNDYYVDGASEALTESNFYSTSKVFWVNMLNGIYEADIK